MAYGEASTEYWTLSDLKQAYLDYINCKQPEISEQQNSRRYRHGVQWTQKQISTFNQRKQPIITYNRISRKIDSIVGLIERFKQDPKAFPKKQGDDAAAELATACVRSVVEADLKQNKLPFIAEQAAIDGFAGVELKLVQHKKLGMDISFAIVQNDEFFYDPRSIMHDFSDTLYRGTSKWVDLEVAIQQFPSMELALRASCEYGSSLTTSSDRENRWFDSVGGRRRVRISDCWYRHSGGWCWCLFTGTMKLMEGRSYFVDDDDEEICKYRMFSCFIDQDGDRYGFIRNLLGPQDEINQRRSKGLHELNSRRIKAEEGAFNDVEAARREAVRPDGVVLYNKDFVAEFDDQTRLANMEGNLKFLEEAKNEIENFGPNPALIGQGLEYKSGRAISMLQQAGISELGPFIVNWRIWKLDLYRVIWSAVKKYWTTPRYISVMDPDGVQQLVAINQMMPGPGGFPQLVNQVAVLDVNIAMDEGPDEVNMMADAYDTLGAMATQGANVPPAILIELSPLPASKKKRLMAMLNPPPSPQQEAAQQLQIQGAVAQVDETRSKAELNRAKAQETAQGGAHGMLEREYDRRSNLEKEAIKAQGREQEHQYQMSELATQAALSHQDHSNTQAEGATQAALAHQVHRHAIAQADKKMDTMILDHRNKLAQLRSQQGAGPPVAS